MLLKLVFIPAVLLVGWVEAAAQENPLRFIRQEKATILIGKCFVGAYMSCAPI